MPVERIKAIVGTRAVKSDLRVAEASKIVKDSAKING